MRWSGRSRCWGRMPPSGGRTGLHKLHRVTLGNLRISFPLQEVSLLRTGLHSCGGCFFSTCQRTRLQDRASAMTERGGVGKLDRPPATTFRVPEWWRSIRHLTKRLQVIWGLRKESAIAIGSRRPFFAPCHHRKRERRHHHHSETISQKAARIMSYAIVPLSQPQGW